MKFSLLRYFLIFLFALSLFLFQKSSLLIYGQTILSSEELNKQKEIERKIYEEKTFPQKLRVTGQAPPSGIDLDVTFIERTPRYNFDAVKNWPSPGETVNFKAYIFNKGNQPTGSFNFKWKIDGNEISFGSIDNLNPGQEITKILSWRWEEGNHHVEFIADPENKIQEVSEVNNILHDKTNALSVGFWVEQSVYNFFNQNQFTYCQDKACAGSNSWEDWAQRQLKEWNRLFETAGVLDRVRLDKVIVVEDCTLPLSWGIADNQPDIRDRTVDLMWGFTSAKVGVIACSRDENDGNKNLYLNHPEFQNIEYPLMHELSHTLHGLPDQYGLNVHTDRDTIEVTDDEGNPAISYFPPIRGDMIYENKTKDLMAYGNNFYGEFNVAALNSFAGQRNKGSNYNPNPSWPLVTSNLPQRNFFLILDKNGFPIPGAKIKIFRMVRKPGFYAKYFDNQADFTGLTDNHGLVEIGHNPFGESSDCSYYRAKTECISSYNWLLLLMIKAGNKTEFQFFEYTDINVAFWKGSRDQAAFPIKTNLEVPRPVFSLSPGWNRITWPEVSGYTAKTALKNIENDCGVETAVAIVRKKKDWWEEYVRGYGGRNFELKDGRDYHIKVNNICDWTP